jgi:electron transport complex protein RnfC
VVKDIRLMPSARGPKTESIVIDVYQGDSQEVLYEAPRDLERLSPAEIFQAVQDCGMVGQGGAAFPSHVKLKLPEGKAVDTLVVNGCECEPYLTCDHRIMLEQTADVLAGARIVMRGLGVGRAMIGVEDNKMDAVKALRGLIEKDAERNRGISAHAVQTKYPQGAEKMLIESLLHRQVPTGGLPMDVGVVVFNVGSLAQLGQLLPRGRGHIERVLTVSGPGVERPGNYLTPVGTPVRFLLEQAGVKPGRREVILGGPMMGMAVSSLDVPVTKAMSGLVVMGAEVDDGDLKPRPVYPCIRCARCVEACPMHLNPSTLGLLAAKRQYQTMAEDFHLADCFECGCCSYVCPSNIPLVQYFRIAKAINREQAA